jgi:hypothetical protein
VRPKSKRRLIGRKRARSSPLNIRRRSERRRSDHNARTTSKAPSDDDAKPDGGGVRRSACAPRAVPSGRPISRLACVEPADGALNIPPVFTRLRSGHPPPGPLRNAASTFTEDRLPARNHLRSRRFSSATRSRSTFRGKRTRKLHWSMPDRAIRRSFSRKAAGKLAGGGRVHPTPWHGKRPPRQKSRPPRDPPFLTSDRCRSRASNRAFFALVFEVALRVTARPP